MTCRSEDLVIALAGAAAMAVLAALAFNTAKAQVPDANGIVQGRIPIECLADKDLNPDVTFDKWVVDGADREWGIMALKGAPGVIVARKGGYTCFVTELPQRHDG
jgi:hypothetical protein